MYNSWHSQEDLSDTEHMQSPYIMRKEQISQKCPLVIEDLAKAEHHTLADYSLLFFGVFYNVFK